MTTMKEIRKKFGMNSRIGKVKCFSCGKELEVPNMYRQKDIRNLDPYCPTTVILHVQWLIKHGWHVTKYEANPPGAFFCGDCFKKGTPEYRRSQCCDTWCEQAEKWMNENKGEQ